jgi:hypothetical protein
MAKAKLVFRSIFELISKPRDSAAPIDDARATLRWADRRRGLRG